MVESDPLGVLPYVVGVIPPLDIGATLNGLVLPEEVVGGGVLAVLLPSVAVHVPQTGLLGLLAVNGALNLFLNFFKKFFFSKNFLIGKFNWKKLKNHQIEKQNIRKSTRRPSKGQRR